MKKATNFTILDILNMKMQERSITRLAAKAMDMANLIKIITAIMKKSTAVIIRTTNLVQETTTLSIAKKATPITITKTNNQNTRLFRKIIHPTPIKTIPTLMEMITLKKQPMIIDHTIILTMTIMKTVIQKNNQLTATDHIRMVTNLIPMKDHPMITTHTMGTVIPMKKAIQRDQMVITARITAVHQEPKTIHLNHQPTILIQTST